MSEFKEIIETRENVIGYIYSQELTSSDFSIGDALDSGAYNSKELKYIKEIEKNYNIFKKIVSLFTKEGWSWTRINPLSRSVLLYGAFELSFNDAALVIDVLVQYLKEFAPDDSYKFVHPILDKIGAYYAKMKKSKANA